MPNFVILLLLFFVVPIRSNKGLIIINCKYYENIFFLCNGLFNLEIFVKIVKIVSSLITIQIIEPAEYLGINALLLKLRQKLDLLIKYPGDGVFFDLRKSAILYLILYHFRPIVLPTIHRTYDSYKSDVHSILLIRPTQEILSVEALTVLPAEGSGCSGCTQIEVSQIHTFCRSDAQIL